MNKRETLRYRKGGVQVMGHYEGRLTLLLEPTYQVADIVYPHRVEAGGRLVKKDVIRL